LTDPIRCPSCGEPLAANAPEGLCPSCLLREGLATIAHEAHDEATRGTSPPGRVDPTAPSAALLAREVPGRYTDAREAARGGMGRVLVARDGQLGREVALKELLPDARRTAGAEVSHPLAARFTREARITAQLQHPAITPVYELGRRDDGTLYYTMKLVRGRTLSQAIAEAGGLDARLRLLPHFVDLCQAIAYAHSRGVLHRDIKPSNVIVGEYGETAVVDWGLAKVRGQGPTADEAVTADPSPLGEEGGMTAHGHVLGTPAYMPPEQALGLMGELDERSDIYALGAVLYEILAGRSPYAGRSGAGVVSSVIAGPPPPPRAVDRDVPEEYARICSRAMARSPADRPASALALAREIEDVKLRPRKRSVRRILERLAVAIVLAIPAAVVLANYQSEKALASALHRMSAKGIDVRFSRPEEFLAPNTPPAAVAGAAAPAAPSSAVGSLYALPWRFPDLADTDSPLWKALTDLESPRPGGGGSSATEEARIRKLVAANQPLLAALHAMARLPPDDGGAAFRLAAGSGRSPFDWEIPDFVALRGAAMLLSHEARLADLDGRQGAAFDVLATILTLSNRYAELPWLISALRRLILADLVLDGFERMQDRLSPGQDTRAFESALGALSPRAELLRGVDGEIKSVLSAFDMLKQRSPSDAARGFAESPLSIANVGWSLYGSGPLRFWINADETQYLAFMTDYVEAVRRPYWEARTELRRIEADAERAQGPWRPVTNMVLVRVSRSAARAAAVESRTLRARIRLALSRYRARHGAYPETLDRLIPAELPQLPPDPVSGRPIAYHLTPTAYWLQGGQAPSSTGAASGR
jgi:serine/threonine protein kinase